MTTTRAIALCACILTAGALPGVAEEAASAAWPQWGGPGRDFRVDSATLPAGWSESGPETLWSRPLGEGYSAVLADGDALYTMYREGDREIVVALDAATGETRWQHAYDADFSQNPTFAYWVTQAGPGPYATPLVVGGRLFAVGVGGRLHAMEKDTGEVLWSRDLLAEFQPPRFQGYASSPLARGDSIVLPVGGPGQGLVAFDQATGEVVWKNHDFHQAPASPVLIDVDGQEQLVVFAQEQVVGVDPDGGPLYWSHPHQTQFGLNIATPLWGAGNILVCSSAYDSGTRALRLTRDGDATRVEELWFSNRMRVHFGNLVRSGGQLIGASGDSPAFFAAVDVETGEEIWRERSLARSHMVAAGERVVIVDEDGDVALATLTASGLDIHSRATLLKENAWTPPTLAGGRLYLRDRSTLTALALGE